MKTQKPLAQMIPQILDHIDRYMDLLQVNQRIYDVLEGQLRSEVEQSLRRELFSHKAYLRAKERIPSINVLRKTTDKLSMVYSEPPIRLAGASQDISIIENITRESNLNHVLHDANRLLNAQNMVAIEPFIKDGKHCYRVLGGHQFLPYSDDPSDPLTMTVFIKLLGTGFENKGAVFSPDGGLMQQKQLREVNLYMLYSDNEVMIIDSHGKVRTDVMMSYGINSTSNPYGTIPVVYKSKSNLQLVPYPNKEGLDISILIPKLLADLNYAAQFLSHSILWTRNADLGEQELNPDVVLDLGDKNDLKGEPEIGTVEPKVDIPNIIKLIEYQMHAYFESVGIKAKASGMLSNGRDTSAVGKALDESDTTNERKNQIGMFKDVERKLWSLTQSMQDVWVNTVALDERRKFTPNFEDTFRVQFPEIRPVKTEKQVLEEIQMWRELKMMSRKQAIKTLRPDFSDEQIDTWLKAVDEEIEEDMEKMLAGLPTSQSERKSDGTFNEGNAAAANPKLSPEVK